MNKRKKKLTLTSETLKNIGQSDLKDVAGATLLPCTSDTAVCTMCTARCATPCCP